MKRLLLGDPNAWLLVEVASDYDSKDFKFRVINGGWSGRMIGRGLYIEEDTQLTAPNVRIISDDQELLSGDDYTVIIEQFRK